MKKALFTTLFALFITIGVLSSTANAAYFYTSGNRPFSNNSYSGSYYDQYGYYGSGYGYGSTYGNGYGYGGYNSSYWNNSLCSCFVAISCPCSPVSAYNTYPYYYLTPSYYYTPYSYGYGSGYGYGNNGYGSGSVYGGGNGWYGGFNFRW